VGYLPEEEAVNVLLSLFFQIAIAVQAGTPMTAGGEGTPAA
jgi:hypothetical protein